MDRRQALATAEACNAGFVCPVVRFRFLVRDRFITLARFYYSDRWESWVLHVAPRLGSNWRVRELLSSRDRVVGVWIVGEGPHGRIRTPEGVVPIYPYWIVRYMSFCVRVSLRVYALKFPGM